QPEERVRNQELAHLVAPVIEDQRAPIPMLAHARVCMLIQCSPVEVHQSVRVFRKMRRHPINDYADSLLMAAIDEVHEIFGRPEAGSRSIIADDLITPGAGEWVLHHRHKLDM